MEKRSEREEKKKGTDRKFTGRNKERREDHY
jgi:hypothetical protein